MFEKPRFYVVLLSAFLLFSPAAHAGVCARALFILKTALSNMILGEVRVQVARRLVLGLQEDVRAVAELRKSGAKLRAKNAGDEFVAAMKNDSPPAFLAEIGGLEMANPGLRDKVEARFFPRVDAELAKLDQADRVAVLGWLSQSPGAWSRTGIKMPIAEFEKGDAVYEILGASNEMRKFGGTLARLAFKKLAGEDTPEAWEHIVAEAVSSENQFGALGLVLSSRENRNLRPALTRLEAALNREQAECALKQEKALARDRKHEIDPESVGSYSWTVHFEKISVQSRREKFEALAQRLDSPSGT